MRIAVDAHAIGKNLTGNEVYIRSLLQAYDTLDPESEFVAYISSAKAEPEIPSRFAVHRVSANPFVRLGWDLGNRVKKDRADLLHVQYTSPFSCSVPVVVSVHDVSFLEHPEYFTWQRRLQLRITVARTVHLAAKVITVSEFARKSILRAYPRLSPDRLVMIPDAASPRFCVVNRAAAVRAIQKRFGVAGPFVLCVGDIQPRKNHLALVRAFASLVKACPEIKHQLILAGKDTWFSHQVRQTVKESGVADRIVFTGFVSDQDLLNLYNACDCFAFPSLYEGFGIPVVEAMACGRAVIAANTAAIPEVADRAAILFDPQKDREIVEALRDVLLNPDLRQRLERLGLQRAAHFSWQKSAEATLEVYREVAAQGQTVEVPAAYGQS